MAGIDFIVLTGRFAAGKDTQAELLIKKFGDSSEIISTGDIYRSAKSEVGEYARFYPYIKPHIEDIDIKGKLLPDSIMTLIVGQVIEEKVALGKEIFIFTGFPRTLGQLSFFNQMLENFQEKFSVRSLFIEYRVSDEVTLERSRKRREEFIQRNETPRPWDTDEGVIKRTSTYYRDIEPMIEELKKQGRLITIEAEKSVPEIEAETSTRLSRERG